MMTSKLAHLDPERQFLHSFFVDIQSYFKMQYLAVDVEGSANYCRAYEIHDSRIRGATRQIR